MSKQTEKELFTNHDDEPEEDDEPAQVILVYSNKKKKEIQLIKEQQLQNKITTTITDKTTTQPFLYLGDSNATLISYLNKNKHITHILNVTKEIKLPNLTHLTTLQIPIQDEIGCDIGQYFTTVIQFIRNCLKEKGCIIVHCYSGISRSASMVAAFLINYFRMEVNESLLYIKSKRKVICPNPGFVSALNNYEKLLMVTSSLQDGSNNNKNENFEQKEMTKNCYIQ